ncbi:MAG: hypothetical protein AAF197_04405 [Pseudomonadota bacterium]
MEPVSIALGIARVTGLTRWVQKKLGKKLGDNAANQIIELATQVTGKKDPQQALDAVNVDNALADELRSMIIANEHELKMAAYEDRKDARASYKVHPEQADKLAERIFKWNLPYIGFCIAINCLVLYYFKDNAPVLATISNVLGMVIKSLFDERKEVSGFYFGGSMHSSPDSSNSANRSDGTEGF